MRKYLKNYIFQRILFGILSIDNCKHLQKVSKTVVCRKKSFKKVIIWIIGNTHLNLVGVVPLARHFFNKSIEKTQEGESIA